MSAGSYGSIMRENQQRGIKEKTGVKLRIISPIFGSNHIAHSTIVSLLVPVDWTDTTINSSEFKAGISILHITSQFSSHIMSALVTSPS